MASAFNKSRWHQLTEAFTVEMSDWRMQHLTAIE
jgi:hypothetical protein